MRVSMQGLLTIVLLASLSLAGCKSLAHTVAQAAPNDPKVRQGAIEKARSSCVTAASAQVHSSSPAVQTTIVSYCDCFATRGLAKFSNQELAEIGLEGKDSMTPNQKAKLGDAINMCRDEMLHN